MNDNQPSPELALSIYSSTAATVSIAILRREGLATDSELDQLVDTLVIARQLSAMPKFIEQHFADLIKMLLEATPEQVSGR